MIHAGPGSGKTFTLVEKIKSLLKKYSPEQLIVVTFTEKAAKEIHNRMNIQTPSPFWGTFHSISMHFLNQIYQKNLTLISDSDILHIIQNTIEHYNLDLQPPNALKMIDFYLSRGKFSADWNKDMDLVLQQYLTFLENNQLIDFNTLIHKAALLIKNNPIKNFEYILVDEVQDCNPVQFDWIATLAQFAKGLFLIGDYNQSIYKFRGAEPENILNIAKHFPQISFEQNHLEKSYRLSDHLIQSANTLLNNSPVDNHLSSASQENSSLIEIVEHPNEKIEKSWLVKRLKSLIGQMDMSFSADQQSLYSLDEIAVLFRTNRMLFDYASYFQSKNIPVNIYSSETTLNDPMIVKILNTLRYCVHPNISYFCDSIKNHVELSLLFPKELLKQPFEKIFHTVLSLNKFKSNQKTQWLYELLSDGEWENNLFQLLNKQTIKTHHKNIQLLTMHSAKGLEFPVVIIPAIEEGNIPMLKNWGNQDIEEEKRLFYVAMTRCSKKLILSYCGFRNGERKNTPFLKQIKPIADFSVNISKTKQAKQLQLF